MNPFSWKALLLPFSKHIAGVLLLCTALLHTIAQEVPFVPAAQDSALLVSLSGKYEAQYKTGIKALPAKDKADYEKIYKQRWEHIKSKIDDKEIHTAPEAQQYLDALVKEIVQSNPVLQQQTFRCYFSRSGIPNASYIGEGIILINMGLFYRLSDESEAAFVISHEIAHFLLKHSENSIQKYVATLNSPEVQEALKKIKGSEFRKREQLEQLVKGLTFDTRRHGRNRESEADSMAVELVHNTRFDVAGALSALALLDNIDKDSLNTETCLQKTFNPQGYPFQKKWIAKEEGLLGGHAVLEQDGKEDDSLKTHPDCKQRIQSLTPLVSRYARASNAKNIIDAKRFEQYRNTFPYEIIAYTYDSKRYTSSLYYTLAMLQKKPTDPWLITHVGTLFNGLYAAQKAHTLSNVADRPSPDYPARYNQLLQFVQNLYLDNIALIGFWYLHTNQPSCSSYEPYTKVYKASKEIAQANR